MKYDRPPCASPAPLQAGSAYDTSELPGEKFLAVLCIRDITLLQPKRISRGAESREYNVTSYDFPENRPSEITDGG
jgi:hypothetical protein